VYFFYRLSGPNAGRIIDCRILEAEYLLAHLSNKSQELNIHLDMVTGDLFIGALDVGLAKARSARQPI